jgi:hypothetical protein
MTSIYPEAFESDDYASLVHHFTRVKDEFAQNGLSEQVAKMEKIIKKLEFNFQYHPGKPHPDRLNLSLKDDIWWFEFYLSRLNDGYGFHKGLYMDDEDMKFTKSFWFDVMRYKSK